MRRSITKHIYNFVVFNLRTRKNNQTKLRNSGTSVATAVGSSVSFPDFSFLRFLETASARPLQEDWGDFARPTSSSCETYLDMHNLACFLLVFFLKLVLAHYNLLADCGLT